MNTHPAFSQELWAQTPSEVRAYIEVLEARQASMGALEARVATWEALGQALQAQLNQTSRHSSRPPASDPPQYARPRRPQRKRRRGGQPEPRGQMRPLRPVADVQEGVVITPEQGRHCSAP